MDNLNPYQAPAADVSNTPDFGLTDRTGPFSPKGRFGRLSYLAWAMVFVFITYAIMFALVGGMALTDPSLVASPLLIIVVIASSVPTVIFGIRRLHDINASGWWLLLLFIPIASLVLALIMLLKPGTESANRFGPPRETRSWEKVLGYVSIGLMVVALIAGIVAGIFLPVFNS